MIPAEKIHLTIIKGGEVIFEELPIESMSMSAPLVCIQTEKA